MTRISSRQHRFLDKLGGQAFCRRMFRVPMKKQLRILGGLAAVWALVACGGGPEVDGGDDDKKPPASGGSGGGTGPGPITPPCTDDCDDDNQATNCGDGVLTEDEMCDDGNQVSGDGCSETCLNVEKGWSCPKAGEPCTQIAICGDGVVSFPEQCDDGNTEVGDGCSERCKLEQGYKCEGEPSVCTETVCGDGVREGTEACDDGNLEPYDGCSPTCQKEPTCDVVGGCTAICGDGIVMHPEQCDDGNTTSGDGCSADCQEEDGYTCSLVSQLGETMTIPVVYRDFKSKNYGPEKKGHPDFYTGGSCSSNWLEPFPGLVEEELNEFGKPQLSSEELGGECFIQSEESFASWYREPESSSAFSGYSKVVTDSLVLTLQEETGIYLFDAPFFLPLTGRGWMSEEIPAADREAAEGEKEGIGNFLFTTEARYWFEYDPDLEAKLSFYGDDDVWVFVGGKLALDLGGTHGTADGSFVLDDATGASLGLEKGRVYEIAVFHAERNPTLSSFKLELSGFNPAPSTCESQCGDGIIALGEECDDGAENNTGGYGRCGPDCKLSQFCGDGIVQEGENCDDGPQNGKPGFCPIGCRKVTVH